MHYQLTLLLIHILILYRYTVITTKTLASSIVTYTPMLPDYQPTVFGLSCISPTSYNTMYSVNFQLNDNLWLLLFLISCSITVPAKGLPDQIHNHVLRSLQRACQGARNYDTDCVKGSVYSNDNRVWVKTNNLSQTRILSTSQISIQKLKTQRLLL